MRARADILWSPGSADSMVEVVGGGDAWVGGRHVNVPLGVLGMGVVGDRSAGLLGWVDSVRLGGVVLSLTFAFAWHNVVAGVVGRGRWYDLWLDS